MKTQYLISNNGLHIAVGIVGDPEQAQADAILAENIYGYNHSDHLFDSLIYMPSVRCFKKFLIMKNYFLLWSDHLHKARADREVAPANIMAMTRRAIAIANETMRNSVTFENFMRNIAANNSHFRVSPFFKEAADYEC